MTYSQQLAVLNCLISLRIRLFAFFLLYHFSLKASLLDHLDDLLLRDLIRIVGYDGKVSGILDIVLNSEFRIESTRTFSILLVPPASAKATTGEAFRIPNTFCVNEVQR